MSVSSTPSFRLLRSAAAFVVVHGWPASVVVAQAPPHVQPPSYEQIVDASHASGSPRWSGSPGGPGARIDPIRPDQALADPAPAARKRQGFSKGSVSLAQLRYAPPAKAVREMARAEEAILGGDMQEGIRRLEKAIEIHPQFIEAHNNLGVQYFKLGEVTRAADEFEKALELDPGAPLPHINLAVALQDLGDPDAALLNAEKAVELAPQLPGAHYNLGSLLSQQGRRLDEALSHLSRVERQYPKASLLMAEALLQQGRAREAREALQRFLALPPAGNVR